MRARTFLPLLALLPLLAPNAAGAAQITVTTDQDTVAADGACSLREAITAANSDTAPGGCAAGDGADVVVIPAGRYVLSRPGAGENSNATGDLDTTGDVTLEGAGAATTVIDAAGIDRVLNVSAGVAVVRGLTITGGHPIDGADGIGVVSAPGAPAEGDLGDSGQLGGGIFNTATLTVDRSRVVDNASGDGGDSGGATAGDVVAGNGSGGGAIGGGGGGGGNGGGIASTGTLTVTSSTIAGNRSGAGGNGGIASAGDAGNGAGNASGGGGGFALGGSGAVGGRGGGIWSSGPLTVTGSTIADNVTGSGGTGGTASGGRGGNGAGSGNGGNGGGANAGGSGLSGPGGGIAWTDEATITDTTIARNRTGDTGLAGAAFGGHGGNGGGTNATGGAGGNADAGFGLGTGTGGGAHGDGPATLTGVTFSGNATGDNAGGGPATGGDGGNGSGTADGGDAGDAEGGPGDPAGDGGGLRVGEETTIVNSTFDGNAVGDGGRAGDAIGGEGGNAVGTGAGGDGGDAFAGDAQGGGRGGAIATPVPLTLIHTTITDNRAGSVGATAIFGTGPGGSGPAGDGADGAGEASLASPAGTGGGVDGGEASLAASVVAGNSPDNCSPGIRRPQDAGGNLSFPDASCPGTVADPKLGPLGDNSGPTQTRALGPDSGALGLVAGPCRDLDQRGLGRPASGCDAGAFELGAPVAVTSLATGLAPTAARLLGAVTPSRRATRWHFEYGTTTAYGQRTPDASAGDGAGPVDVFADVGGLAPATTYHFRLVASNIDGTTVGADQTFLTPIAPTGGGDTTPPSFASASLSPATFAVDPRGAREVAVSAQRRRARRGTRFRYRLSEPARVVFTIQRARSGRRVGGKCRARTKANRKRRRCTRFVRVGRFAQQATTTGTITKRFSGRIGRRSLKPGRHRAVLVATDAAGNKSRAKRLTFRIVRRR